MRQAGAQASGRRRSLQGFQVPAGSGAVVHPGDLELLWGRRGTWNVRFFDLRFQKYRRKVEVGSGERKCEVGSLKEV
jgi:hypothetical protein